MPADSLRPISRLSELGIELRNGQGKPELHGSLTMASAASEMTYEELVENDITDNSFVRLVDVKMDNVYVYPRSQKVPKNSISRVKVISTPEILSAANTQLGRYDTLTGRVTYHTGLGFEVNVVNRVNHVSHQLGGDLDLRVPSEIHNPKGLYTAVGIGLIVLAYDLMINQGRIGLIGGDLSASAFGFAAGAVGLGAA